MVSNEVEIYEYSLINPTISYREVVKNGYLMARMTIRVWGHPPAQTISKCGNFGPIFSVIKW